VNSLKFKCTVKRDTFSPELQKYKKRASAGELRAYLGSTSVGMLFRRNIDEAFRQQIYFNGIATENWRDLKQSTIFKRQKRKNWRGMSESIHKETLELMQRLLLTKHTVRKTATGQAAIFQPSGIHSGYDGQPMGVQALLQYHEFTLMRPILTLLPDIRENMVRNFTVWFFR